MQISGQAAEIRKADGQNADGAEIVDCAVNEKANKWILQPRNGPYYAVVGKTTARHIGCSQHIGFQRFRCFNDHSAPQKQRKQLRSMSEDIVCSSHSCQIGENRILGLEFPLAERRVMGC